VFWEKVRSMYKLRSDVSKNRLYVQLEGLFTLEEMKRCVDETIAESRKLKHGYTVVTDISQLRTPSQDVATEIERVQAHFVASAVAHGARVVGESVITGMQFRRTSVQAGYPSINVRTLAEAESFLDSLR